MESDCWQPAWEKWPTHGWKDKRRVVEKSISTANGKTKERTVYSKVGCISIKAQCTDQQLHRLKVTVANSEIDL